MYRDTIFQYVKKQYGTIPNICGMIYQIVQYFVMTMENGTQYL